MAQAPSFSIVINTDARAESLAVTLESLRYLDYPCFEVCVVRGPTADATTQLLADWAGRIKTAECPERNLAVSRNIGIALAAGEIVAFIDDDAIPEAEWLRDLAPAFDDPAVGGAGGVTYDHSGTRFQYRLGTANRMGDADPSWSRPAPEFCFPFTANFPHLLGTNCSFRRKALLSVGGFDEEFEYYLDETDLCCRLVDAGWMISQLMRAYVHHKFLPSELRNEHRVIRHWYAIIKNKIYFSLVNAHGHHGVQDAIDDARRFVDKFARDVAWAISQGYLTEADRDRFSSDVDQAWRDGLARGLRGGARRLTTETTLRRFASPFLPLRPLLPAGERRTFCFFSREYPPGAVGGVGRYTNQLARSIAALGHHVHVLTIGADHDRTDFERGVWVHRLLPGAMPLPGDARDARVPQRIWDHAATMLAGVEAIAAKRRVDCVHAPIWDCEGFAVLLDKRFPLLTSLHTTLHSWLESYPDRRSDATFMEEFVTPMVALERRILRESDGIEANSAAIVSQISKAYGIDLTSPRVAVIPHGLEDWRDLSATPPPLLADGTVRILFVGRLEARKGVDVLLAAMQHLMPRYPQLRLDIVGNDALPGPEGRTYRAAFESDPAAQELRPRVRFHGEVDEKALRGFYRACDIFIAPSRFESFGLVLIEAMIFSKPIIACRAGGMVEIIEDGVGGLLAEPGDLASLCACVERLVTDSTLRARLGAAGRARYEEEFTAERMAFAAVAFLDRVAAMHAGTRAGPEWEAIAT